MYIYSACSSKQLYKKCVQFVPLHLSGGAKVQVTGHRTGHRSGYRSQATGQVTGQTTGHRSGHRSDHRSHKNTHKTVVD